MGTDDESGSGEESCEDESDEGATKVLAKKAARKRYHKPTTVTQCVRSKLIESDDQKKAGDSNNDSDNVYNICMNTQFVHFF